MPPHRTERHTSLSLRGEGGLTVAIVADTHSNPHPASARCIATQRPDVILHAGDIGNLSVLDDLAKLAPVIFVRGNVDARSPDLPDVVTIDVRRGEASVMKILLLHIAVYGPKLLPDAARLAQKHAADIVVCGHSHVPFLGRDRGRVVFNAGSIGPRRIPLPIVFGVLEIKPNGAKLHHVDCETGERWRA